MKTIVNSLGLILTVVGVYGVYCSSPINEDIIDGGRADDDRDKQEKETSRKNLFLKRSVWIIVVGTLLQLLSNFIPEGFNLW